MLILNKRDSIQDPVDNLFYNLSLFLFQKISSYSVSHKTIF
ncbi:uncharacterized protein METZ01_LOCUS226766 [marine metagenome]|uniref:Uncharacterized protein n=1 Tax=marine metagenome TaxID=408172 RepID=A0A382GGD6_9ZZZZ